MSITLFGLFKSRVNKDSVKKTRLKMSTYKLKLNQVREVLGMAIKFETAKLQDGTVVEVEKLEVGFPVVIVKEDGSKVAAPAGEHVLENGVKIELDANGVIMEIEAPVEVAAEEKEEEVAAIPVAMEETTVTEETTTTETPIKDAVVDKIEEKLAMLFEAIEEVATEVATVKEEMGAMKTKMEKFSKLPAGNKIPKTAEATIAKNEEFNDIEARVAALRNLRNELTKK